MINYFHIRDGLQHSNAVTIAYLVDNDFTLFFGFARCSLKDQFSRHIGRTISCYRLLAAPITYGTLDNSLFSLAKQIAKKVDEGKYQYLLSWRFNNGN